MTHPPHAEGVPTMGENSVLAQGRQLLRDAARAPWFRLDSELIGIGSDDDEHTDEFGFCVEAVGRELEPYVEANADLIVFLRNNAEQLLDLWEAARNLDDEDYTTWIRFNAALRALEPPSASRSDAQLGDSTRDEGGDPAGREEGQA